MREWRRIRRGVLALAAVWMLAALGEIAEAAPRGERGRSGSTTRALRSSSRTAAARRLRANWRSNRRPVIRTVGVTLPQLRTELGKLESGITGRLQRVERVVSRPQPPPVVITPPPPPPPVKPGLPLGPAAAAGLGVSVLSGGIGFALGQAWGKRRRRDAGEPVAEPTQPWSQLQQRLEETQRRLSNTRARLHRLERGA